MQEESTVSQVSHTSNPNTLFNSRTTSSTVSVRTVLGGNITIAEVLNTDSIFNLKEKIAEKIGIPPENQKLVIGKTLLDDELCSNYNYFKGINEPNLVVNKLPQEKLNSYITKIVQELNGAPSKENEELKQTSIARLRSILDCSGPVEDKLKSVANILHEDHTRNDNQSGTLASCYEQIFQNLFHENIYTAIENISMNTTQKQLAVMPIDTQFIYLENTNQNCLVM